MAEEAEKMTEGKWKDTPVKRLSSLLLLQVLDPTVLTERILRQRQGR